MLVNPVMKIFRVLTWCCVVILAVLSLWPGKGLGFLYVLPELNTMRTGLPGQLEHFIAYAGSAAVGMTGYGASRGDVRVVGSFWVYAAILEYLQQFSPGRHPSIEDFAASALGALCGGLAVAFLWRRRFDQPR
jgi:VanZ family protein